MKTATKTVLDILLKVKQQHSKHLQLILFLNLNSYMVQEFNISICNVCMNRSYHLKETLLKNVEDSLTYSNPEYVILEYNWQDGMATRVGQYFGEYIEKGRLNIFICPDPQNLI